MCNLRFFPSLIQSKLIDGLQPIQDDVLAAEDVVRANELILEESQGRNKEEKQYFARRLRVLALSGNIHAAASFINNHDQDSLYELIHGYRVSESDIEDHNPGANLEAAIGVLRKIATESRDFQGYHAAATLFRLYASELIMNDRQSLSSYLKYFIRECNHAKNEVAEGVIISVYEQYAHHGCLHALELLCSEYKKNDQKKYQYWHDLRKQAVDHLTELAKQSFDLMLLHLVDNHAQYADRDHDRLRERVNLYSRLIGSKDPNGVFLSKILSLLESPTQCFNAARLINSMYLRRVYPFDSSQSRCVNKAAYLRVCEFVRNNASRCDSIELKILAVRGLASLNNDLNFKKMYWFEAYQLGCLISAAELGSSLWKEDPARALEYLNAAVEPPSSFSACIYVNQFLRQCDKLDSRDYLPQIYQLCEKLILIKQFAAFELIETHLQTIDDSLLSDEWEQFKANYSDNQEIDMAIVNDLLNRIYQALQNSPIHKKIKMK